MGTLEDPFMPLAAQTLGDDFAALEKRDVPAGGVFGGAAVIGRLHGFDLLEQALIVELPPCPGQVVPARSTVPLRRSMIGRDVVVLFDGGDFQRPIVVGVIEVQGLDASVSRSLPHGVTVEVDSERHIITAEREIVLRCGEASITLTRAGKVIIEGRYILSRSTGYNKIKGAAVDIN